jgi:predicted MPP superfamily phosphohydrolase
MIPYLQLQACYFAGSGLAVAALDWAWGRREALRESPARRAAAVLATLAIVLLAWALAVRHFDHSHSTYQFISIAIGFYAGLIWVPLATLVRALRKPRRPPLAAGAFAVLATGQYALWIEPDRLVTNTHELRVAAWSPGEPLRVVHVSDLQTVGACDRELRAAELVNAFAPDLIVYTGDFVAGPFFDAEPGIAAARRFFEALKRPRLGIVCVMGHSESERVRARVLDGLNVIYLRDEEVLLDCGKGRRLRIFGSKTQFVGTDLSRFARRDEPGLATLFVSHEPDLSSEIDGRDVDLHLAGHTHGGQIALPFYGPPFTLSDLPARFARGLHRFGDHWLHVNPGIGMEGNHAPRIRFWCPPEVDLLLLDGGGESTAASPGTAGG